MNKFNLKNFLIKKGIKKDVTICKRILTATEYFDIIFPFKQDGTLSSSRAPVVIIKTRLPRNLRSRQAPVLSITSVYQFEMLLLASMETTELTGLNKEGLFSFF